MAKKGYSRQGLLGTNHYDSSGRKIGESRQGIFGAYVKVSREGE